VGSTPTPGTIFFKVYAVIEARPKIAPFSLGEKKGHFGVSLTWQSAARDERVKRE
jgi:hypothetical protein